MELEAGLASGRRWSAEKQESSEKLLSKPVKKVTATVVEEEINLE